MRKMFSLDDVIMILKRPQGLRHIGPRETSQQKKCGGGVTILLQRGL